MEILQCLIKKKYNVFAIATFILLITVLGTYLYYRNTAFAVAFNGKDIGIVKNKTQVNNLLVDLENDLEKKYNTEFKNDNTLTFKRITASQDQITSTEIIKSNLEKALDFEVNAYAIEVDDESLVYLSTREEAEMILEKIKNQYTEARNDKKMLEIGFAEDVRIIATRTKISNIWTIQKGFNYLASLKNKVEKYKVAESDSAWSIAKKLKIKVEDIEKANPGIDISSLKLNQEINLNIAKAYINVKVTEIEVIEEKIPYKVVYEGTKTLAAGQTKTKSSGQEGLKRVKVEQVKINGITISKNVLDEEIIKQPQSMIVLKGSNIASNAVAYGDFRNPSRGTLTSRFGTRWGRSHTGIDVASPVGTDIKAADKGEVIFAGWKSGYGKLVIVKHEDGIETYYAHCDELKVKVGESVSKGQLLATVGKTGQVTGPNLHFEVRKNGKALDPLKYVNY